MNNELSTFPCSDQVCENKFHLTESFTSVEQVEKQLILCQDCEKIDSNDTIAETTYQNISVLWAERHNQQVGQS
jgi:hypothetical protein